VSDDIQLNDPQTLYRRWEDSQWSPFSIDLTRDAAQWPALDDDQRGLLYFVLASLMVAEERITTKFSGLVGAHGSEEEATFLSTQQVDEARHMQFYARFQDEVVADPGTVGTHVQRAREHVSDAFRQIFDVALVQAHEQLVAAPADLAAKVRFVTIYHLILESTLGLTTFRFATEYLEREGLLPGFVEGYSLIHRDETRHIGYGRRAPGAGRHGPRHAARPPPPRRRVAQASRWRRRRRTRRHRGRPARLRARRHDPPASDHRGPDRDGPRERLSAVRSAARRA
jgi:ribonucleoside-diphosphate reductase beta chain